MNNRRNTILQRNESGQALTEFALVLPLLALLLFGVIQFGIVFNHYVTITDAARAGARKAAVSKDEGNPAAVAEETTRGSAQNLDQDQMGVSVSASPAWEHGADVTVTVTYPYQVSLVGMVVASGTLESSTTERIE